MTTTKNKNLKSRLRETGYIWGPETHMYGVNGFMTYGPAGKQLKLQIESIFRDIFVKDGFFEIETPCLYATSAWVASGHFHKFGEEMFSTLTSDGVALCGRPEMATTLFSLLPLLLDNFNQNSPLKIYQMGVALPNDRQTEFQTRTRQYTAHEGHLIFKKGEFELPAVIESLKNMAFLIMTKVGIPKKSLVLRKKVGKDKPFYATLAYGLYAILDDKTELEVLGIQYRSKYDFEKHKQMIRGKCPEDFEISFSSDRPLYVLLNLLLANDKGRDFLNLPFAIAPYKFAVLPVEAGDESAKQAKDIANMITQLLGPTPTYVTGKMTNRYAMSDLVGIPYTIVINKDGKIFIRDRNTGKQSPTEIGMLKDLISSDTKDIFKNISNYLINQIND